MAQSDEVRSLLMDVYCNGVVVIQKRKLLWLLGWGQDREKTWEDLLAYWTGTGLEHGPGELYGLEVGDKIVLTLAPAKDGKHVPVTEWT